MTVKMTVEHRKKSAAFADLVSAIGTNRFLQPLFILHQPDFISVKASLIYCPGLWSINTP